MWKVTILLALLSAVRAANMDDIYGKYTTVMVFTYLGSEERDGPTVCLTLAMSKDERNGKCTCADGQDCTLVEFKAVERIPIMMTGPESVSTPMLAMDKGTDIRYLRNVTCHCVDKDSKRNIVKKINDNYILISDDLSNLAEERDVLLARKLPSNAELEHDITLIDEVKNKRAFKMCTREIREQLLSQH